MNDLPGTPTHRPAEGAVIEPRAYDLRVMFHPPIRLDRKTGFAFASQLTEYIDPQNAQLGEANWLFSQPMGTSPGGGLQVAVAPQQIAFNFAFPSNRLEWIEQRCEMILSIFEKQFKPMLLLTSGAAFRGVMPVDGDARVFLAERVMKFNPEHLNLLHRPMHVFGIKLVLPPFMLQTMGQPMMQPMVQPMVPPTGEQPAIPSPVDWQVEVKAESLMEDTSKLYLDAEALWMHPSPWTPATVPAVVGHLATVSDYLQKDIVEFLRRASSDGEF